MKEKIINIRNILKIIISLFIIFTMIKSCGKAYSFNDFIDFCEQVSEMQDIPASYRRTANRILTNETKVRNAIGGDTFISFIARVEASANIELYCFSDRRTFRTVNSNPPYIYYSGSVSREITIDNNNGVYSENNTGGTTWFTYNGTNPGFGLIESTEEITNWYNLIFNNRYSQYTPLEFDQNPLNIVSYNGSLARSYQRRHLQYTRSVCRKNNTK